MKRALFLSVAFVMVTMASAQLNVQLHYDLGHDIYGDEQSLRPRVTATVENFTPDKWGSTYFFIDADIAGNSVKSAYGEISREFCWWKFPMAVHLEFNGGLSGSAGSFDNAYLIGPAWNWHSRDFSKTFSVQLLYKYQAHKDHHGGTNHSVQLTEVWGLDFAGGLFRFSGYCDLWYDKSVNGHLVLSSEPQFWLNMWKLRGFNREAKWSVGTEVEVTSNLVWPKVGKNNRFYVIPTLAMKWTF